MKKDSNKKPTSTQSKRAKIPQPITLRLWAAAAGRCEFRGCNERVWQDKLTLAKLNLANISHIIAASPEGPRGHVTLSKELQIDYDNLMLTCLDHSRLIDNKQLEDEYPIELLQTFKHEHEERIRRLTDIQPELKTYVVIFTAKIGERPRPEIKSSDTFEAIIPKYPLTEDVVKIELPDFTTLSDNHGEYWKIMKEEVKSQFDKKLSNILKEHHLSIFALAPIPLLIYFGSLIGNTSAVDLFQRHRGDQNWKWKDDPEEIAPIFNIERTFNENAPASGTFFTPYGSMHALETALQASKVAIEVLLGNEVDNPVISWKGDASAFKEKGYGTTPRFELSSKDLFTSRYGYKDDNCPICGTKK